VNIIYFADISRGLVAEAAARFECFAKGKVEVLGNCFGSCDRQLCSRADIAVVLGGDGSIIHAAHSLFGLGIPVAGINMGRLGFLAEFNMDGLEEHFGRIFAGDYVVEEKMMLDCEVITESGKILTDCALNDIAFNSGRPFSAIELEIEINSNPMASCLGDGLVICSPTGSTAYNLSAGGPIMSKDVEAIGITPLNPHTLTFRSVLVGPNCIIEIFPVRTNEGSAVIVDGRLLHDFSSVKSVRITRSAEKLKLIGNPCKTQWDALAYKLKWAQKPHYKI
jgi:NAD+ kinase